MEQGDLPESTVQKYKQLYKKEVSAHVLKVMILVTSLSFHRRSEDNHLHWE